MWVILELLVEMSHQKWKANRFVFDVGLTSRKRVDRVAGLLERLAGMSVASSFAVPKKCYASLWFPIAVFFSCRFGTIIAW